MRQTPLLKGTLDLLILKTLELEKRHGLLIAQRIEQLTNRTFRVKAGSLFPALHRLEQWGYVSSSWETNDAGRRIKSYSITSAGRRQLAVERRVWEQVSVAVNLVLSED